jgi:hypothetical protein
MKNSSFNNLLMTALIIEATSIWMRCYADNPIIQTKYSADPDTAVNNANGFSIQKTGSARNPIIFAEVPDMSMVRVDDMYYMSSTIMHMSPGVPVMKSKDLITGRL